MRTLEHFALWRRHFGDLVRLRILVDRGDYGSTVNLGLLRPWLITYTTLHHIEYNNAAHNRSYQHHYNRLRFPLSRSHLLNRPNFNYLRPLSCICVVFYIFYLFILHNSDNIYLACFVDPIIGDSKIHFWHINFDSLFPSLREELLFFLLGKRGTIFVVIRFASVAVPIGEGSAHWVVLIIFENDFSRHFSS